MPRLKGFKIKSLVIRSTTVLCGIDTTDVGLRHGKSYCSKELFSLIPVVPFLRLNDAPAGIHTAPAAFVVFGRVVKIQNTVISFAFSQKSQIAVAE